jgi:organic radical activating enzyme
MNEKGFNKEDCAEVSELFASLQGEGKYVGFLHIFVRFANCNLNCAYCDTLKRTARMAVEFPPGSTVCDYFDSPVQMETLLSCLERFVKGWHYYHALSLTGGEPLLQPPAVIEALCDWAHSRGLKTLLETNGTLPGVLSEIVSKIDIVSMDIKIQSATSEPAMFDKNLEFLQVARRAGEVYVKVVVCEKSSRGEIEEAAKLVSSVDRKIELFIQPVTPRRGERFVQPALLFAFYQVAAKYLDFVRILPQCHRFLNIK